MGVPAILAPKGLRPQNSTKKWVHSVNFWVNQYLENQFTKYSGLIPPLS